MKTKMNDLWINFNVKAIEFILKVKKVNYVSVTYNPETKLYTIKG